ncbi:protein of unknown function [Azospirillum baldaniorum]|uniref:Uncharacterized protein n=1 Tax=Azospirillum baldaniorum TaxID=1064539 RepID=A0A9P1JS33_9PROT|nr:protein of unknown function [Azospirillum baldaniorum]
MPLPLLEPTLPKKSSLLERGAGTFQSGGVFCTVLTRSSQSRTFNRLRAGRAVTRFGPSGGG